MVFFTQNKGNEARRRNARFGHKQIPLWPNNLPEEAIISL